MGPPHPYPPIPRCPPIPSATIPSPQAIALSSPGASPSSGEWWLGSTPESPSLGSYIVPEESEATKSYQDYFNLPVDMGEGPSGVKGGSVDRETNGNEYEGMKEHGVHRLGCGMVSMLIPTYQSECTPKWIRWVSLHLAYHRPGSLTIATVVPWSPVTNRRSPLVSCSPLRFYNLVMPTPAIPIGRRFAFRRFKHVATRRPHPRHRTSPVWFRRSSRRRIAAPGIHRQVGRPVA